MSSLIDIPENYWVSTTTSGDVMLEYEEVATLRMEQTRLNARLNELEKIRIIAKNALEAIEDSGLASIATLSLKEIREIEKRPNG